DGDLDFDQLLLGGDRALDLDLDLSPFIEPDLDLLSAPDLDLEETQMMAEDMLILSRVPCSCWVGENMAFL
ncbi:Hypothetical predicted protein, partial [Marmota monax]